MVCVYCKFVGVFKMLCWYCIDGGNLFDWEIVRDEFVGVYYWIGGYYVGYFGVGNVWDC